MTKTVNVDVALEVDGWLGSALRHVNSADRRWGAAATPDSIGAVLDSLAQAEYAIREAMGALEAESRRTVVRP